MSLESSYHTKHPTLLFIQSHLILCFTFSSNLSFSFFSYKLSYTFKSVHRFSLLFLLRPLLSQSQSPDYEYSIHLALLLILNLFPSLAFLRSSSPLCTLSTLSLPLKSYRPRNGSPVSYIICN